MSSEKVNGMSSLFYNPSFDQNSHWDASFQHTKFKSKNRLNTPAFLSHGWILYIKVGR